MNKQIYLASMTRALIASSLILTLVSLSYFLVEPKIGRADTSGPFTISQVVTDETSFIVDAANTTLSGSINGITGGTANGSTTVVVQTNSPTGYVMDIAFFDNGTPQTMNGNVSASQSIRDYATTEPTYSFSTASTSAVFAYTVTAATLSDLDQSFKNDNSSACNTGAARVSFDACWMEPKTTNFRIINRPNDALTGATSTIYFRVHVPNNPTPGLVADTYTATATLTAVSQ